MRSTWYTIGVPCAILGSLAVYALAVQVKYERELEDMKVPSEYDREVKRLEYLVKNSPHTQQKYAGMH